jgi:hypothetical protein
MYKIYCFSLVYFILLFYNCAPSRYVKPLQKNQQAVSFTFGGPIIKFAGAPIPVPFTTLGYAYGVTNKITAHANIHTTSALFANLQTDIGSTFEVYKKENKFGITFSPALQIAYNIRNKTDFKIWPSIDANAYFHFKEKPNYLYVGANSWIELSKLKAHQQKQTKHAIPNIHIGYTIVKTKWQHQFELNYLGIGIANKPNVPDFIGIVGKGTLGFYYCLIRKF